jgi:bifunctional non-homologous end joining protein LigD
MSRLRTRRTSGHIDPCLPSPAERPPFGDGWIHEIKHDGFRIMARRDGAGVRLVTRHGNDFTSRFPLAVAAVQTLPGRSFLIDGEAIVTNERGLAVFDLIRHQRHGADAVLIAFDLIQLDGEDLRRSPLEHRKRMLAKLVRRAHAGIVLNEVFEGDGVILFEHACKLGCEGIVSKRLGSTYRSGRSANWIKVKSVRRTHSRRPAAPDLGSYDRTSSIFCCGCGRSGRSARGSDFELPYVILPRFCSETRSQSQIKSTIPERSRTKNM